MAVISGLIAAGAAIGGAALSASSQKKAAKKAAAAQTDVAAQNNALQADIYNKNTANLSPWMDAGKAVNPIIQGALGIGDQSQVKSAFDTYNNSTGYQFRMDEGLGALASKYRAMGVSKSGAGDRALVRYGQDYGSNEFGNWFNRLAGQQGVGLSAASALAGVGTNFANATSANNQNAADAISNSAIARGNANSQMYGSIANSFGTILGGSSYGGGILG